MIQNNLFIYFAAFRASLLMLCLNIYFTKAVKYTLNTHLLKNISLFCFVVYVLYSHVQCYFLYLIKGDPGCVDLYIIENARLRT